MSGVEDDPRSRYSDFSCVTPLEQLINEIEQILIKTWRVRDHVGWTSGRSENVELRCPMLAEGAIRLELFDERKKEHLPWVLCCIMSPGRVFPNAVELIVSVCGS